MRSLLRTLGRLLRLTALAAVVIAVVRAVTGRRKPEVTGQASWPPLTEPVPAASVATTATPTNAFSAAASETAEGAQPGEAATTGTGWVEPVDGACPATHPIKGNAQSMIYHVPGGASYDRTVPERCYASVEAAEADGFRAARR